MPRHNDIVKLQDRKSSKDMFISSNRSKFVKLYTKLFDYLNPNQACVLSLIYDRISLSMKHSAKYFDKNLSAYFVIFSRAEIAKKLSISPSTVSRTLNYLRSLGYIDTHRIFNGGLRIFCPKFKCYLNTKHRNNHKHHSNRTFRRSTSTMRTTPGNVHHKKNTVVDVDHKANQIDKKKNFKQLTQKYKKDNHNIRYGKGISSRNAIMAKIDDSSNQDKKKPKINQSMKNGGLLLKHGKINNRILKQNNLIHQIEYDFDYRHFDNSDINYIDTNDLENRSNYNMVSLIDAFFGYRTYDRENRLMVVPDKNAINDYFQMTDPLRNPHVIYKYMRLKMEECEKIATVCPFNSAIRHYMAHHKCRDRYEAISILMKDHQDVCDCMAHKVENLYMPYVRQATRHQKAKEHDAIHNHMQSWQYHLAEKHINHKQSVNNAIANKSKCSNQTKLNKFKNFSLPQRLVKIYPTLSSINLRCRCIHSKKRNYIRLDNAPQVADDYGQDRITNECKYKKDLYTDDDINLQYLEECLVYHIKIPMDVVKSLRLYSEKCPLVFQTYVGIIYESKYHAYHELKDAYEDKLNSAKLRKDLFNAFRFGRNPYFIDKNRGLAQLMEDTFHNIENDSHVHDWESYMINNLEHYFIRAGKHFLKCNK